MSEVVMLLDFAEQKGRFLEKNPTLSGLSWNSAKSTVSVTARSVAELFNGISFMKKNIKVTRQLLFRLACIQGWCSEHGC